MLDVDAHPQAFNGQWVARKGESARRQHAHNGSTLLAIKGQKSWKRAMST